MSVIRTCESNVNPIKFVILQIHDCENDLKKKKKKNNFFKIYLLNINKTNKNNLKNI